MNVMSFKLVTGEELIAELDHDTVDGYAIKTPLVVMATRTPEGPRLDFARWSLIQEEGKLIYLKEHALMALPVSVIDKIAQSYAEMVTGLILPPTVLHG